MAADLLAPAATASFLVRQATTAAAFTRAPLGYTDRSRLFSRLKPGHHVLEIGPGEGVCHRHFPPGLVYTALDPSLPMTAKRLSVSQQRNVPPPRVFRTALPVERSCASFSVVSGFWQVEMPRLVAQSKRFDAVLVTLPSTIYFGPDDRVGGSDGANEEGHLKGSALLRSALRIPRPRAEWGRFAADVSHLLKPGGVLLVAELSASHSWAARRALPFAQWEPPLLSRSLLTAAGFSEIEVVSGPQRWWHEPEVCLCARR